MSFDRDTRKTIYDEIRLWLANFTQEETAPRSFGELFTSFFYGPSGLTWWQRAGYWLVLVLFVVGLVLLLRVIIILSLLMRERFGKPVAHDRQLMPTEVIEELSNNRPFLLGVNGQSHGCANTRSNAATANRDLPSQLSASRAISPSAWATRPISTNTSALPVRSSRTCDRLILNTRYARHAFRAIAIGSITSSSIANAAIVSTLHRP